MSDRKPGFYFIAMSGNDWTVAEWVDGEWFVPGTECAVEFDGSHVGPRIPSPDEDWVCVPMDPTKNMLEHLVGEITHEYEMGIAKNYWNMMLTAAPKPEDE